MGPWYIESPFGLPHCASPLVVAAACVYGVYLTVWCCVWPWLGQHQASFVFAKEAETDPNAPKPATEEEIQEQRETELQKLETTMTDAVAKLKDLKTGIAKFVSGIEQVTSLLRSLHHGLYGRLRVLWTEILNLFEQWTVMNETPGNLSPTWDLEGLSCTYL